MPALTARIAVPWRAVAVFVFIAFGLAFLLDVLCALTGGLGTLQAGLLLVLRMFAPAVAAFVVCRWVTHERFRPAIGLAGAPWRGRSWLRVLGLAMLGVAVVAAISAAVFGLAVAAGWLVPDWQMAVLMDRLREQAPGSELPPPALIGAITLVQGLVAAFTINGAVALGEEAGWRGWLLDALAPLGTLRSIAIIGIVWGLWHAPLIAMGYEYSGQVPTVVGIGLFCLFCTAVGALLTWLRLRSGSVVPAAIAHGAINGLATAPALVVGAGERWDMVTSSLVGVPSILLFALVAGLLFAVARPRAGRGAHGN